MGNKKNTQIQDEITLLYGKSLPKRIRVNGPFNVYGSNGIVGTHEKAMFKGPGIIIGRKGTVGSVVYSNEDFNAIDTTYVVELKDPNDSLLFWYYYLQTLGLEKMNSHSAVPGLNRDAVYKKEIQIFDDLDYRKAIAATLSCLDDKIELNNRMNQTLEEMAQALFKSWFVDFEPFQDGEFVDSELGRIPKGWSVGTIKELTTEMKNGGTPSRKKSIYWESRDFPWIKTGEIKNNILIEAEEWISKEGLANSSAKLLPKNTVLIALYGATAGQVGFLKFKASTNQACCGMICDSENKAVFLYLYLLHNQKYISSLSVGAAQQNLSKDTVSKLKLIIPTDEVLEKTIFKVLFSNIEKNIKENQKLNQLRNTFLPKLMSGEVRVPIPEVK